MGFLSVGVDPGSDGGIVAVYASGELAAAHRMPKTAEVLDLPRLRRLLLDPAGCAAALPHVYGVEDVHAVAVNGTKAAKGSGTNASAVSNFGLGRYRGHLEAYLELATDPARGALASEVRWIRTGDWQALMLGTRRVSRQTKALSIARALRLFPRLAELAPKRGGGITDGIADAACLAEFLRLTELGRRRWA